MGECLMSQNKKMQWHQERMVLVCENTLEGIWTAVYDGWTYANRGYQVELRTEEPENQELFTTCVTVQTDEEKAQKVSRSIRKKLGIRVFEDLCYAAVSTREEKGTAIFQVLYQALCHGRCNRDIMQELADPYVNQVSKLRIKVWHELHRFLGFVRFREVGGKVLFSKISPENDLLEMLGPHFANRFPLESWMIYDEHRGKVLLHPAGGECTVHKGVRMTEEQSAWLDCPEEYETLWRTFCETIAITERENPGLQRQFLPLKFRSNMTEF